VAAGKRNMTKTSPDAQHEGKSVSKEAYYLESREKKEEPR
jgi:hypothetical protein